MKSKRAVVVVTNHNYGNFLKDCIDSVLGQYSAPEKIVVVDDGSTDNSLEILSLYSDEHVHVIPKSNGGQLSCFNIICKMLSSDDIVFMLDADDIYPPDYIREARRKFELGFDVVLSGVKRFRQAKQHLASCIVSNDPDVEIHRSVFLTLQEQCWIGTPTSGIALTGAAYLKIFPYCNESDWVVRADDVVVYGSSILGLRKLFSPSLAISYRVHENNNFYGQILSQRNLLERGLAVERLFEEMSARSGVSRKSQPHLALLEADQIPKTYATLFFIPPFWRLKMKKVFYRLWKFFIL